MIECDEQCVIMTSGWMICKTSLNRMVVHDSLLGPERVVEVASEVAGLHLVAAASQHGAGLNEGED